MVTSILTPSSQLGLEEGPKDSVEVVVKVAFQTLWFWEEVYMFGPEEGKEVKWSYPITLGKENRNVRFF